MSVADRFSVGYRELEPPGHRSDWLCQIAKLLTRTRARHRKRRRGIVPKMEISIYAHNGGFGDPSGGASTSKGGVRLPAAKGAGCSSARRT